MARMIQDLYHHPPCRSLSPKRTRPPSRRRAGVERRSNHSCASAMYTYEWLLQALPIKLPIKNASAANSMASPVAKKRASPAAPYGDSGPSLPSFEPIVQILKRSTNPTGATPAPIAASSQKSLVEREREYQQARQRIFGTTSDDAISSNDNIPKGSDAPSVIQRQPQGPSSEDAVGFRGRSNRM